MKLKGIAFLAIVLCTYWSASAQCLNGGCEVGISRSQHDNGVFIGHYEDSKKLGLGITYEYSPKGKYTSYANYNRDKKNGVQYEIERLNGSQTTVHTFTSYVDDVPLYPAMRITKENRKTNIEVAFSESNGWKKYTGDKTEGDASIKSIIHEGTPAFLAINGKDVVMAITATVSTIELLSSNPNEKYYNALQILSKNDLLKINIFPKAGADETSFVTNVDWDMQNPQDGTWLYKRYFNNELSYKFYYEDVLALPSQKDVKQQKLQKAFDFITQQIDDYDFDKGYEGRAKDFIDMLKDIKERAQRKGLDIPITYDIAMFELHLRNKDEDKALYFAKSAYLKSTRSYDMIAELISSKLSQHSDILTKIKSTDGFAINNN